MPTTLIIGANRGIGLALVRAYIAAGDTVLATARDLDAATDLRATGAELFALDVADGASVAAFKTQLGGRPIDLLIHNAGIGERTGFGTLDYDAFEQVMAVNTIAPFRVIEALADNVAASQGKTIAAISSQMGSIENTTADFGLIYRVSKAGLNMGLRAAAVSLATRGVTVLTVHPGWVRTDMGTEAAPLSPEESAAGLRQTIANAGASPELRFLDWQGNTLPW